MKNSNRDNRGYSGGGVGVSELLLVAFIVLKLTGVIDWPWVWVLAPFWIPLGLVVITGLVWSVFGRR